MPEVSFAQNKSVFELIGQLQLYGAGENATLRGRVSGDGSTVLYTKNGLSNPFGDQAVRKGKQDCARQIVRSAVEKEFSTIKPGGKFLASVVQENMRHICSGKGEVTLTGLKAVQTEAERVRAVYVAFTQGKDRYEEGAHYLAGKADHAAVVGTIEGFDKNMSLFDGLELYAKLAKSDAVGTPEVQRKLGALGKWIAEASDDLSDKGALARAKSVVDLAVELDADSVRVMPQDVPLRQIGDSSDQQGRCFPMVAVAALAESAGPRGADQMVRRFEQETQLMREAGKKGPTTYVNALATLHNGKVLAPTRTALTNGMGKPLEKPGHRKVVQHLALNPGVKAGKPVFYGLEVHGHILMVGATKHGGKDSFVFYDPNFGMARFSSPEKLSDFMDGYFNKLGYAKEYLMADKGVDGYAITNALEYDLEKVKSVKVLDLPAGDPGQISMESLTKPRA